MKYSSRILLYSKLIIILYSISTLLYSQENSFLPILKKNDVFQALKGHFTIDQYLPVLIPESYTNVQKYNTLKSELDTLFLNWKNRV